MWAVVKKKPLVRTLHATSSGGDPGEEEGMEGEGVGKGWVTAVAAFPNSDLVASGVLLSAVPNVSCMCIFPQYVVYKFH